MKKIIVVLFLIMSLLLVACQNNIETDNKLKVAVSIVPQKTFVKAVGGDLVNVVTMIPPGNSPANYAPSPKELTKFSESDIYFSIGVPADLVNILPKAKEFNSNIKIVKLHERVKNVYKERNFSSNSRDPHIWLSPKRVKVMIKIIKEELGEIDNINKEIYIENANKYIEKLNKLDEDIKDSLDKIKNNTFIVYHPIFGYFADDYGLEMLAIEKDGKEATPQRLQEIIDIANNRNIKTVFYQAEIDSKQSRAIVEEIDGKAVLIKPLAEDYIKNMRKVVETFNSVLD